jgi:uncharacterized membrane protein HdeD (DUF308 family)
MSAQQSPDPNQVRAAVTGALREHSTFFLVEGVILLVLGVVAILLPPLATIAVTGAPGFWWSLVSAVIATAAGLVLLIRPVSGAISLTLLLIAFFAAEGAASILYALEHRRELTGRWEWMLVSGVIDLVLAGIILAGLPGTAAWALGVLVGVNMIFGGTALIAMALHARRAA